MNMYGPKRDEVTGEWRRLHNEKRYDLYSPNIIRVVKSRRMRGVGHVARMGERKYAYGIFVGSLKEGDHLEDPGVDGTILLNWIFKRCDEAAWTGFIWLRIGTGGGLL
jgi:hypothetical protein